MSFNFREAKQAADEYQRAKVAFYSHVESHGFGRWIQRPPTAEQFQK